MMVRTIVAAITAIVVFSPQVHSAPAPTALHGKSIIINWSENRIQRDEGNADFRSVQASQNMSIYISSMRRIFNKMMFTTRRGSGSREQIAGQGNATRVPDFRGRSLTIFMPYQGGMRRISVEFDGSFTSCSAKVIHAKKVGSSAQIGFSPITKRRVEFQSATASGESCEVRSGNVFGGS